MPDAKLTCGLMMNCHHFIQNRTRVLAVAMELKNHAKNPADNTISCIITQVLSLVLTRTKLYEQVLIYVNALRLTDVARDKTNKTT